MYIRVPNPTTYGLYTTRHKTEKNKTKNKKKKFHFVPNIKASVFIFNLYYIGFVINSIQIKKILHVYIYGFN